MNIPKLKIIDLHFCIHTYNLLPSFASFILLHKSDNFEPEHKEREDTNEGLSNLDEAKSFKLNHRNYLKIKYSKIKPGGTK